MITVLCSYGDKAEVHTHIHASRYRPHNVEV